MASDADDVFAGIGNGDVNAFDVVDRIGGRGVRHGVTAEKLIAAIHVAVRRDDFKIEIVDERGDCGGQRGHVGVGERDDERFHAASEDEALLEHAAVREQDGLIHEIIIAR